MSELDDVDGPGTSPEAPQWLDEREDRAWRSFLSMQSHLRRVLGRELQQQTGLSDADYAVLVHLSEAPSGRLRPMELGDAADWEKSRLSHHLTRMERRGLVERQICPSDSRGAFVALTPAGRTAIEVAAPFHVAQVRRWFVSAMTPAQLETLTVISEELLARLEPQQAEAEACDAAWAEPAADDAGADDAGTVHAGAVDAGTVDRGTDDAGTVDRGTDDAGAVDSEQVAH
ncbi:MAG: MarR family winged helix-turn-helix transcriptional regulator [Acidimicrobiales bacterium]|jgi:DNA-binding MarR family transcriptional regulator